MQLNNYFSTLKKNAVTIVLAGLVLILIVSPDSKSWLLQQMVSAGLFKAEIKKDGTDNLPDNALPFRSQMKQVKRPPLLI